VAATAVAVTQTASKQVARGKCVELSGVQLCETKLNALDAQLWDCEPRCPDMMKAPPLSFCWESCASGM